MTEFRRKTGQRGEQLAADYLRRNGYDIIRNNWRCTGGEIDIIARHNDVWVFVEVRSRNSDTTETAFESITRRKRDKLTDCVHRYLQANQLADCAWRIDVIAVALSHSRPPRIDHVEDALDW
jgi:putative endonuclease